MERHQTAAEILDKRFSRDGKPGKKKKQRPSQSTLLVALAEDVEFFHGPDGEAYGTVQVGEHRENLRLRFKVFRRWLVRRYYQRFRTSPGAQAVQDAIGVLEGRAIFDGPEHPIAVRIAEHQGRVYLDLADKDWRAVEVSAAGWKLLARAPIKFIRPRGLLSLPEPLRGGMLDALASYVNVLEDDEPTWQLLVGWILGALRPVGPYPVLVLHGEQGSAKTTTARVLRELIDPNAAPVRAEPRDARDLMIAASNGWVVSLDNMSYLHPWLSDALCRLSTGGGWSTRELYTDAEEIIFEAKRPVLLNGIEEVATRSDLLDRSIALQLPALPEKRCRPEADFWKCFEKARPGILGALLDALAGALAGVPDVRLAELPRMADFAVWVSAAEPALGWEKGSFLKAYRGNRTEANDTALDSSLIAPFILELARAGRWEGTCTELLDKLASMAGEKSRQSKGWPGSPRSLSGQLRRLAPNLRRAGVDISLYRDVDKKRQRMVGIYDHENG
jgi:hypothetical protein